MAHPRRWSRRAARPHGRSRWEQRGADLAMTRPVWARRFDRWSVGQVLPWMVFALVALSLANPIRAGAAGDCTITIDGQSLGAAGDSSNALAIDAQGNPEVVATSSQPVSEIAITVSLWPLSWTETRTAAAPTTEWVGTLPVADFTRFGSGVYQVTVTTEACQVQGWVDVEGPPLYQTVAGIVGLGTIGLGVLLVARSILAARRGGSIVPSILGGAITGVGLLIVAQQTGTAAVTPQSAATWVVIPSALSGIGHAVTGALAHAGAGAAAPAGTAPSGAGPVSPPPPPPATPTQIQPPPAPPPTPTPTPVQPPPAPTVGTGAPTPSAAGAGVPGAGAAGAGATIGPSAPDDADPPRTSYALLQCPDAVVATTPFRVVLGLSAEPDAHVIADPLVRPETSHGAYTMTIQLIADGMQLVSPDATWRLDLPVTAHAPYPTVTVDLVADAQDEPVRASSIRAMYSVDGNPIGLAIRSVAIVRTAELIAAAPPAAPAPGVDLALPSGQVAPDLTVRIERAGPGSPGQLLLQMLAADPSIEVPDAAIPVDIGDEPAADLHHITGEMQAVEGKPTQFAAMRGIGLTIADRMPLAFWDVLRAVAALHPDRPPAILFLSAEPYVPWELALVDPPLDPSVPPFLSAQATGGRWVLGQRRPPLPPPLSLTVHGLAAVSGVYELPGWQRLLAAEGEAADLVAAYHAAAVNANTDGVLGLLRGTPRADVIHFAVHGSYGTNEAADGLILVDGETLDPIVVLGTPLHGHPFVFLNACQVAQGDQLFGDQAGLAAAFLSAGASAVIAPLWSIDDELARQISARFYERALKGDPPAEIMRSERAAFLDDPKTVSSTYMAYQYFGHPGLRLEVPDGASE